MISRHWTLGALVIAGLLTGCGGGGTSPTPPPPPPPPPPPGPSSVSISAGDQQQAEGGAAVSVAPAVLVRNAQGQPVSGVTVTFSVAEGGGTLAGGTPSSDASGIARVTSWTLGPNGTQRLAAQVGTITPVVFQATLTPGTEELIAIIPAAGGPFEITTPGHPYQGLKLTVPSGTFAGPAEVHMRVAPSAVPPTLPAGYRVGGPVLEVATMLPYGDKMMTLDIPVTRVAGEDVVIALYDPVRKVIEVMPTVARTPTSVRVMTAHLRADFLLGPVPAPAVRAGGSGNMGGGIQINLIPILQLIPTLPVTQVINPATDRWPVIDHGSSAFPDGHGAAIAAIQTVSASLKAPIFAGLFKALATPGFYADAAPLGTVITATRNLNPSVGGLLHQRFMQVTAALKLNPKQIQDELVHRNVVANLALTLAPTMLALNDAGDNPMVYVSAVAGTDNLLTLMNPAEGPLDQLLRQLSSGFDPLSLPVTGDGPPVTVVSAIPVTSMVAPLNQLSALVTDLASIFGTSGAQRASINDRIGAAAGLPAIMLEQQGEVGGAWGPIDGRQIVARSPATTIRIKPGGFFGSFTIHIPIGPEVARVDAGAIDLSTIAGFLALPSKVPTDHVVSTYTKVGGLLRQVTPATHALVKELYGVTPNVFNLPAGPPSVTLDAPMQFPPAGGYQIKWDWGDGTSSTITNLTTATHLYAAPNDYTVVSTLMTPSGQVLGKDNVDVKGQPEPFWRITNFVDQDQLDQTFTQRIVTAPQSGLIAIEDEGAGRTVLRLRVLQAGIWDLTNCCPPTVAPLPGELQQTLGIMPQVQHAVGPYFAGWNITRWAQSTQALDAGTLTGQYVDGITNYNIQDAGTQAGPNSVFGITATRNGTTMTGTITVTGWLSDQTGVVVGIRTFRFPFTAVRLR